MSDNMGIETMLGHYGEDKSENHGAIVSPIYQNSLFTFESWEAIDKAFDDKVNNCIYTRGKNPTVNQAEEKIAKLAGGEKAKLFSSGMAAISSAVMHFLEPGDHVVTVNNIYGPTTQLLNVYLKCKMNIETTFVDGRNVSDFEEAITDKTKLIYIESPSSAVFKLQDIAKVTELAKRKGIKTILDNTWATPIFQKPLTMGVDLEVHSCSKYFGGHSDLVAGAVIGNMKDVSEIAGNEFELLGGIMSPFEAWLITRSLRTMAIRMEKHQKNTLQVAQFLEGHPKVKRVDHPGLESFPQYELGKKQMTGYSGLFAFELDTNDLVKIKKFFNGLKYFYIGVSWGGHESLIYAPAISYMKELSPERFKEMNLSYGIMRVSIGLEDHDDLIKDLTNALELI